VPVALENSTLVIQLPSHLFYEWLEEHYVNPEESIAALKKAYRIIWHEGLNRSNAIAKVRENIFGCPEVEHLLDFIEKSQRGVIA
jgi:acyl-[acyl carrier protein]--UDP-N-acetylglucosamine O-acyltransferase